MDLEINLSCFRNQAEDLAILMMKADRPGYAQRFRKAAAYAAGVAAFLRTQEELPADPLETKPSPTAIINPPNVHRLKPY